MLTKSELASDTQSRRERIHQRAKQLREERLAAAFPDETARERALAAYRQVNRIMDGAFFNAREEINNAD